MPSLRTCLHLENIKHRRSLALTLAVVAPVLIAVFVFFNLLRDHRPIAWDMTMATAAAIWAYFMLPMSVTALTVLVAQAEHGPRAWDYLHALPVARWKLYAAKMLWVLLVVAAMSAAVGVASWLAAKAAGSFRPSAAPTGNFDAYRFAWLLLRMYLSSFLLISVQIWIAHRHPSFVPALATGIGGTFFAVVASSARIGVVLPWQIPVNMLAADSARMHLALAIGLGGGIVAMLLSVLQLGRREVL